MDQKENSSQDNTNPDAKILEQGTFSIDQRKLLKYYLTNTESKFAIINYKPIYMNLIHMYALFFNRHISNI
jgi:hypothetical protein